MYCPRVGDCSKQNVQEAKESLHTDIFGNTKKVLEMGKINMHNLRTPSTEQAREMQKKSAEKRSQNIKERKLIRQVIEERLDGADLDEIVDNLIDRAKRDSRDFEVLQAALGQKPIEKVQATQTVVDMSAFSTDEIKAMLDDDIP